MDELASGLSTSAVILTICWSLPKTLYGNPCDPAGSYTGVVGAAAVVVGGCVCIAVIGCWT